MVRKITILCMAMIVGVLSFSCSTQPTRLKIISFNIRNSGGSPTAHDGDNCWGNRRDAVISMISQEQPDAIGLQECLPDQEEYLSSNLKDYKRIGVGRDDGDREGEMMAIYYNTNKLDLLENGDYWLSETPDSVSRGWDGACRRIVTWGLFSVKATGEKFYYFNTHLDHVGKVARRESIKLIVSKFSEIVKDDIPYVLSADFNSQVNEDIYNPLKEVAISMRDSSPVSDTIHTYNAYGNNAGAIIDHIFVKGFVPVEFQTILTNYGVPYISDHYPVKGIVEFAK